MKYVCLLLVLAVGGNAQAISVVMENLGPIVAARVFGTKETVWRMYITTTDLTATSIPRSAVTSLTPISEFPSSIARDVLAKQAGVNRWALLGRGWDEISPLAAGGLSFAGWAADSREAFIASVSISGVNLVRKLLKGQAPTPGNYVDEFLPTTVPCVNGNCGEWFVMTSFVADLKPIRIDGAAAKSALVQVQEPAPVPCSLPVAGDSPFCFKLVTTQRERLPVVDGPCVITLTSYPAKCSASVVLGNDASMEQFRLTPAEERLERARDKVESEPTLENEAAYLAALKEVLQ